ncbi:MAG: hypothetical protein WC718_18225 [Phycisphaerales bacterium]|jgi:hypothetical protein
MDEKTAKHELECHGKHCTDRVIPVGAGYVSDGTAYYCLSCAEAPVVESIGHAGSLA